MNLLDWALPLVVWLHLAATLFLVGLIWCVQVVHYPLMSSVGDDCFVGFHRSHSARISWIVVLPMVLELVTSALLVWPGTTAAPRWMTLAGLGLVVLIWGSTFGLQVPIHRRLASGFDGAAHRALVRTNWVRTAAWSLRGALAIAIASQA